jgi:hypothetical protein
VIASRTFACRTCGQVASTLSLVGPGQPDPRLTPEPPGAPPGISTMLSRDAQLSIAGGPVTVTLGLVGVPVEDVARALAEGAAALYDLDPEFAPFWCPTCRAAYCGDHFEAWTLLDDGFFDCIMGMCPERHERVLED